MDYASLNKLVINLPERTDRLANIHEQLGLNGYMIVPGQRDSNVLLGIARAHLSCVQIAKENNWPEVLIMEDDLVLRPGFEEYLNHCIYNRPHEWDLLLGGVYNFKTITPHNNHWDRLGEFRGLHFYIVNSAAYDRILSYEESGRQHIDAWMNRHNKGLKCFVTKKFIATQLSGYSDNAKQTVDYSHLISKNKLL